MNELDFAQAVLAVEIDLGEQGPSPRLPAPLEREEAERLGVRLAADLGEILPGIQRLGLAACGALYDPTQVLSPGFPLFTELAEFYRQSQRGEFTAQRLTLGAADGAMPGRSLVQREGPAGALLLLPLCLVGPRDSVEAMRLEMETVFIEKGQTSPASALALQQAFGVGIPHARFMTLNDLCAMLRLQLEHVGLKELWDLIDGALFTADSTTSARTETGNAFVYHDGRVASLFQTFDGWAQHGAGQMFSNGDRGDLGAGYAGYLRVQRQFLLSLEAHGVPVDVFHLDGAVPDDGQRPDGDPVVGPFVREVVFAGTEQGPLQVTEHATAELGSIAWTVESVDAQGAVVYRENLFPVRPEGLQAVQQHLQDRSDSPIQFAWPGRLCYDPEQRCLIGDPDLAQAPSHWH